MYKLFSLILVFLLFLTACSTPVELPDTLPEAEPNITAALVDDIENDDVSADEILGLTFDDVLAIASNRRICLVGVAEERLQELLTRIEPPEDLSDLTALRLPPENQQVFITREEAIYDAALLLELLRYGYGAYAYFGGDEVFLPMFERIKEVLSERETWRSEQVKQIFANHLQTAIADNHSDILGRQMWIFYQFFVWETPFDLIDNRFYHRETGRYVTKIIGYDINDVFRLAMDEDGDFFYVPIFERYSNFIEPGIYDFTFTFDNGDEQIVTLNYHPPIFQLPEAPFLRWEDEIPVVGIQQMEALSFNSAQDFLSFADMLKDEPVIIIDVRSNMGGNRWLAPFWLYSLTGEIVNRSYERFIPFEYFNWERCPACCFIGSGDLAHPEEYLEFIEEFRSEHIPGKITSNEQLIIMLIDRRVGSAGEIFADLILGMENTLVIGQNTTGVCITSEAGTFYLPHSGAEIGIGMSLNVFPEGRFKEGRGIDPDVWVIGDALTAALALLQAR